jgi:prolipoprotein diacylglyceryltransferase
MMTMMMMKMIIIIIIIIIIITTWSRDLPEKLTVSQVVKKFPAFYGTQRFITAFTRARHLSLS